MKIEELVNEYLKEHRHDILLNPYDGLIEFTELFLSELMKDAVEGYVNYYEDSGGILMAEAQVGCPYHNGDKVRIVILKEEE